MGTTFSYFSSSTTNISSTFLILESLCAIMITVLPSINFEKACCISYSFSGSLAALASSRIIIGASFRIALVYCNPLRLTATIGEHLLLLLSYPRAFKLIENTSAHRKVKCFYHLFARCIRSSNFYIFIDAGFK